MSGGQKGFTLIELLVVIAILGVIAAIVALNVSTFFGRGTLQAANTELHQVQTAIISAMADGESGTLTSPNTTNLYWAGGPGVVYVVVGNRTYDAGDYVYGPFRAAYHVTTTGEILVGILDLTQAEGDHGDRSPWSGIRWNDQNKGWEAIP